MNKTNAMRILDQHNIKYEYKEYEYDEDNLGGEHVVEQVNMQPEEVFKTLVAKGAKNKIAVFCIPVANELDLKKAAKALNDKSVEMIHVKDLLDLTGYVRGGCSPIGMKKKYPTFIDETCILFDKIGISAGARGKQLIVNPNDLISIVDGIAIDLVKD